VPLARHRRFVAGRFEDLGNRHAVRLQRAAIAGLALIAGHEPDAGLMRVQAGQ
jgi:hypothetical protein